MIGVDTNVVVRYLVQDDPQQAARATAFIEQQISAAAPGYISLVVLTEIAWVLRSCYGIDRQAIARTLRALLQIRQLSVERPDLVVRALRRYTEMAVDFSDALIVEVARDQGCTDFVSFDRKGSALGMRLP